MVPAGRNGHDHSGPGAGPGDFEIAELRTPSGTAIGLSQLPGMRGGNVRSDLLERDLEQLLEWRATAAICPLDRQEGEWIDVERLSFELRRRNIGFLTLPLPREGPDPGFEDAWTKLRDRLAGALERGQRLMVLCIERGTRCGIVAARVLIDSGADADAALRTLREVRPDILEHEVEENVREYAARRR